jgi:drug/metabolite transporter (DMT)-like permease|uniref:DMT family transporter n=1 Tax=Bacteroides uniformis TaxID=820 RepID=UPI0040271A52
MRVNTALRTHLAYVYGLGSGFTWGLDTVLIGVVMGLTPFVENPLLVVGGTFICSMFHDVFAAFWMGCIMGAKGRLRELKTALCSRDGLFCVLGALLGGPLAMTFYVLAIQQGGPALTATVTACYPLLGSALAVLILKEKMPFKGWLGLCVCILGIAYIGYAPDESLQNHVIVGIIFAGVAAIGWALEAVVCGYGMRSGKIDPWMALLIRETISGTVYTLLVVPVMLGGFEQLGIGINAVMSHSLTFMVLGITALIGMSSFVMWYTAIDIIGAARSLCLNVTYSVWAVILSFLFIGGEMSINVLIGAVMVVSGVTMATLVSEKL